MNNDKKILLAIFITIGVVLILTSCSRIDVNEAYIPNGHAAVYDPHNMGEE